MAPNPTGLKPDFSCLSAALQRKEHTKNLISPNSNQGRTIHVQPYRSQPGSSLDRPENRPDVHRRQPSRPAVQNRPHGLPPRTRNRDQRHGSVPPGDTGGFRQPRPHHRLFHGLPHPPRQGRDRGHDNIRTNAGVRPSQRLSELANAAAAKVAATLIRLEQGNLSNVKSVGEGVLEFWIDWGPGYRIYLGRDGGTLVILLHGGTKQRQQRDIETAKSLWLDYKRRRPRAR